MFALTAAGVGTATAAGGNTAITAHQQTVTSGAATLVLQSGQTNTSGPAPAWDVPLGLLFPIYGNLTNTGDVQPAEGTIVATGLPLGTIQACDVAWVGGSCPKPFDVPVNTPIPSNRLPALKKTWFLKVNPAVVLGSKFYATAVKPLPLTTQVYNS